MDDIIENTKSLINAKSELLKLELIDKGVKIYSSLVTFIFLVAAMLFISILFLIVLVVLISTYLDSYVLGSVITFFLSVILTILGYFTLRVRIKNKIKNKIYKEILTDG